MKDKLQGIMQEFCREFGIAFNLRFSGVQLSNAEIGLYNAVGSGSLANLISQYRDVSAIRKAFLERQHDPNISQGVGIIEPGTYRFMEDILRLIKDNKVTAKDIPSKYGDYINIILYARQELAQFNDDYCFYNQYKRLYQLFKENQMEGTLPIMPKKHTNWMNPLSWLKPSSYWNIGKHYVQNKGNFETMIHEGIHYVLGKIGIYFQPKGMSPLDEGICTFLHIRFRGNRRAGLWRMYDKASQYKVWATFFDYLCRDIRNNREVIPFIVKYSQTHNLIKEMREMLTISKSEAEGLQKQGEQLIAKGRRAPSKEEGTMLINEGLRLIHQAKMVKKHHVNVSKRLAKESKRLIKEAKKEKDPNEARVLLEEAKRIEKLSIEQNDLFNFENNDLNALNIEKHKPMPEGEIIGRGIVWELEAEGSSPPADWCKRYVNAVKRAQKQKR